MSLFYFFLIKKFLEGKKEREGNSYKRELLLI